VPAFHPPGRSEPQRLPGGDPSFPDRVDLVGIRDLLPALIDSLADAIVVVDRERRVVAANRRYVEAFGVRRVDVAGSACTEALHCPEARESLEHCVACTVIERRAPQRCLRNLADSTGALRRWEAAFTPVLDPAGEVTHVVEVWRDITDRSQLEVQLSHSERLASVGMLAAGVAHEINNPLASMLTGVEVLGRWLHRGHFERNDLAEAAEIIAMLEGGIERCRDTTEKMMMLGRAYNVSPSWVDLNAAARDTLALLRFEMQKRNVVAVEDFDPELPEIWAREAAMRGVCMNLMINAVQAMASGGRLTVTTRGGADQVTLVIEDTGVGITPEHLERIWDPFFTTKPVGQGTGLGLSITNRILVRHGGRAAVESAPGHGARFTVELPVHGPGGEG